MPGTRWMHEEQMVPIEYTALEEEDAAGEVAEGGVRGKYRRAAGYAAGDAVGHAAEEVCDR